MVINNKNVRFLNNFPQKRNYIFHANYLFKLLLSKYFIIKFYNFKIFQVNNLINLPQKEWQPTEYECTHNYT